MKKTVRIDERLHSALKAMALECDSTATRLLESILENELQDYLDLEHFERASIRQETSGLPVRIWVSPNSEGMDGVLAIKVSRTYGENLNPSASFNMSMDLKDNKISEVGDTGKIGADDILKVRNHLKDNKDLYLKFWNYEISDDDLVLSLKKFDHLPIN